MAEKFVWLALPNDEAEYLLYMLVALRGGKYQDAEEYSGLTPIIHRLKRQVDGLSE